MWFAQAVLSKYHVSCKKWDNSNGRLSIPCCLVEFFPVVRKLLPNLDWKFPKKLIISGKIQLGSYQDHKQSQPCN